MFNYVNLSFAFIKDLDEIRNNFKHNHRLKEVINADIEKLPSNRIICGSAEDDPVTICQKNQMGRKIRKNGRLCLSLILSASENFFKTGKCLEFGYYDQEKLEAWVEISQKWMAETFGDRIFSAVLHLDETKPHIHYLLVIYDSNHKSIRKIFNGPQSIRALLTSYSRSLEELGLLRPVPTYFKFGNDEIKYFYGRIKNVHTHTELLPDIWLYKQPEISNHGFLSKAILIEYLKKSIFEASCLFLDNIKNSVQNRQNSLNEAKKNEDDYKQRSLTYVAKLNLMIEEAKSKRELVTLEFLKKGLGAELIKDDPRLIAKIFGQGAITGQKPFKGNIVRQIPVFFKMPDESFLMTCMNSNGYLNWSLVSADGQTHSGHTLIELMKHELDYPDGDLEQIVCEIDKIGHPNINGLITRYRTMKEISIEEKRLLANIPVLPDHFNEIWPEVKEELVGKYNLEGDFLEKMVLEGFIKVDRAGQLNFVNKNNSYCLRRGPLSMVSYGYNNTNNFILLDGDNGKVLVTNDPLEALTLKCLQPNSTVMALTRDSEVDFLEKYCSGKKYSFLCHFLLAKINLI